MNGYFKLLRRKIGVVTLVVACVFMAGWMRSVVISDQISIRNDDSDYQFLTSRDGFVSWYRYIGAPDVFPPEFIAWNSYTDHHELSWHDRQDLSNMTAAWRWEVLGFDFGKVGFYSVGSQITFVFAPYCAIVIPLTLVSTWLLLSKPLAGKVTSKSQQICEH